MHEDVLGGMRKYIIMCILVTAIGCSKKQETPEQVQAKEQAEILAKYMAESRKVYREALMSLDKETLVNMIFSLEEEKDLLIEKLGYDPEEVDEEMYDEDEREYAPARVR